MRICRRITWGGVRFGEEEGGGGGGYYYLQHPGMQYGSSYHS